MHGNEEGAWRRTCDRYEGAGDPTPALGGMGTASPRGHCHWSVGGRSCCLAKASSGSLGVTGFDAVRRESGGDRDMVGQRTSEVLETYRGTARRENCAIFIRGKTKGWAKKPSATRRDSAVLFASIASYKKSTASSLHGTSEARWSARPENEAVAEALTHDARTDS